MKIQPGSNLALIKASLRKNDPGIISNDLITPVLLLKQIHLSVLFFVPELYLNMLMRQRFSIRKL